MDENEGGEGLREEPLVQRLVPDPAHLERLRVLTGYLGRSTTEGRWRLYQCLTLDIYVEFDEADVRHQVSLSTEADPLGGSVVWLKCDADLRWVSPEPIRAESEFLTGEISSQYLGRPTTTWYPPDRPRHTTPTCPANLRTCWDRPHSTPTCPGPRR